MIGKAVLLGEAGSLLGSTRREAARDAKVLFLGSNKCAFIITKWVLHPVGTK